MYNSQLLSEIIFETVTALHKCLFYYILDWVVDIGQIKWVFQCLWYSLFSGRETDQLSTVYLDEIKPPAQKTATVTQSVPLSRRPLPATPGVTTIFRVYTTHALVTHTPYIKLIIPRTESLYQ